MEWPKLLFEAQFHAVWGTAEGDLVDVTPSENAQSRILFLRDRKRRYVDRLIPSRQRVLAADAGDYVRLCKRRWELEAAGYFDTGEDTGVSLAGATRREYEATLLALRDALSALVAVHGNRARQ